MIALTMKERLTSDQAADPIIIMKSMTRLKTVMTARNSQAWESTRHSI